MGTQTTKSRARRANALVDDLTSRFQSMPASSDSEVQTEPVTEAEAADLGAFCLAIADGLTEEDIRQRDPDLFRRLQARYMTEAEITRERLNQLPHRQAPLPATRARPLSGVSPGARSGAGPIPPLGQWREV